MSDIAISVENLGKMYRIGGQQRRYKRFTETMMNTLAAPLYRLRTWGRPIPPAETLWALKEISFEVKEGEVVGIVGSNGAGKSTLLKVLSRITEPSEGEVRIYGRVGSLLEVGTGFHPELTGRENIYLNGTILGMRKAEIERKFDEIVTFAGVEKFLDTPVKRYSSGMYVRLAFAVAAHLEPEILVVDEVLAVGDAQFQKKCLGKIGEVARGGRTVLFVSHNMTVIENLCPRSILLEQGRVAEDGPSAQVVARYIETSAEIELPPLEERKDRPGDGKLRFTNFEVISPYGIAKTGSEVRFRLHYSVCQETTPLRNVAFAFAINTLAGNYVLVFSSEETNNNIDCIQESGYLECIVPFLPLAGGTYSVNLYATINGIVADSVVNAAILNVDDADYYVGGGSRHSAHPIYVAEHYWITG